MKFHGIKFKSIKTQITVAVVTIVAGVCIGLAATAFNIAAAGLKTNMDESMQEVVEQGAHVVHERVNNYFERLNSLATNKLFQNSGANKAELMVLLKKIVTDSGCFYMIAVDANGNGWTTEGVSGQFGDREYYTQAMQGENYMSDPRMSVTTGKLVVTQAVPVKNNQNQVVGIIALSWDGNVLSKVIADISYGKSGKAFMVNRKGTAVADYDPQKVIDGENTIEAAKKDSSLQPMAAVVQKMADGASGMGEYQYQGVVKYMAYHPVPGTHWSLGLTAPKTEVFASLNRMREIIAVISLFFLGIGGAVSFFLAYRISFPVQLVSQRLELIATGDVDRDLAEQFLARRDEIGKLAHAAQNLTVDLREKADAAQKIANGDLNIHLTLKSEKDILTKNLSQMMQTLESTTNDISMLAEAAIAGNLTTRADALQYNGVYRKMISGINDTLDAVLTPLNIGVQFVQRLADGEAQQPIDNVYQGDFHTFIDNLNYVRASIHELVDETTRITHATAQGDLNVRGNLSKLKGVYAEIVKGLNDTLDAIVTPLNDAGQVLEAMAVNDYTLGLQVDRYQGMLRQLATNINMVQTRLLSVQDALIKVSAGDISRLEEFRQIGKRSENDRLMPAVGGMMQTIQSLIDEVGGLTQAAVNGELQTRGNADKFTGQYRQIVIGFNRALDAILEPIKEAFDVLQEMATGNLAVAVKGDYQGEHALLAGAVNHTIDSFNEVLGEFYNVAGQVATGAQNVSDSSQIMSQGASEQAATTEEITASIEEIAVQTKHNAENATKANNLAIAAQDQATAGNDQMQKMLEAMMMINDSSASISKIIKVIDEIAFQTNILALNAAVEAARAGQYGKGFAVVAEEVRNLAARSANAARETTGLIESSVQKVTAGTQIANETAQSLEKIVTDIATTTTLVGDIATASNEQAAGITQVNQGMNQIAQVTQTNTSTAEESAAASEELAAQAEVLMGVVQKFTLKKTGAHFSNDSKLAAGKKLTQPVKQLPLDSKEFGKY
jgi:methyl-accepting chemotaxis protein